METLEKSKDMAIAASHSFKEREYWVNKFSGELLETRFLYDFTGKTPGAPGEIDGNTGTVKFALSGELFSLITKLSNGADSRTHMICVAAVVALLHRYTGNNDIIVGIPVDKQEIEGEFINTVLALRNSFPNHISFKELLLKTRDTIFQAAENQNYPIEALLYDLDMKFSETGFPLFDVAVVMENIQDKEYLRHINVSMIFSFLRTDEAIQGVLHYNPLFYHKSTVLKISKHFRKVLEQVLTDMNVKVKDIEILLEEEKKKLLVDFNNTKQEYPKGKPLHGLFEEQVEKTPAHQAVSHKRITDDQSLSISMSYDRLNEKANRLAWILKSKGVKPGVIVGIMVESPTLLVTCLLGILKAGGAYLPFSIRYPGERKIYMLKDSQAGILIKDGGQSMESTGLNGIEVLDIDDLSRQSSPASNLPVVFQSSDAAYIIYTSGTTGKPRGVVVEHGSVVNTLVCRKEMYRLNPEVTALQLFSPAFDGFVTGFFTPIIAGASVVLLSEEDIMDITRVKAAIVENKVTHFISIPSLYRAIIEELTPEESSSLKVVTLAGDRLSSKLLEETTGKNPGIEIAQEYGVTEAAVMSTLYRHQEKDSRLKIGSPIWNTRIYIFSENLQLQPIGVPGHLCIAGPGVARGYLNKPGLTAEKFFFVSYRSHRSYKSYIPKKIYRTGDLARWSEDGNIEFIGRIDYQVKVMGFRIELGEIENQLLKHELIKEALVMARETQTGRKYLCAYIIPYSTGTTPTDTQLRDYLVRLLPDYMVPLYFLVLNQVPLTSNGKIDRNRLPEPDDTLRFEYVAPRNELEETLAEIWKSELNLERVGINDNYFNIGGDSIKSIKLINIINSKLNKKLKLAALYANNSIEKLAKILNKDKKDDSTSTAEYDKVLGKIEALKDDFIKGI